MGMKKPEQNKKFQERNSRINTVLNNRENLGKVEFLKAIGHNIYF